MDASRQIERYRGAMLGFAMKQTRGDRDRAEDIVQDACIRVYRFLERGGVIEHPASFFPKIVLNLLAEHGRRKREDQFATDDFADQIAIEPQHGTDALVTQAMDSQEILAAVVAMPPIYREVLLLRLRGLKFPEIAQRERLHLNTVRTRFFRAKQFLSARLDAGMFCRTA